MSEDDLFVALSIYDRHGGLQNFNRRLVRALTELSPAETGCVVVISLADREDRDLGPRAMLIPCGGSRTRLIRQVGRVLRRRRPGRLILGHINLLPLALLARLLIRRVRIALVAHGIEMWGDPRYRRSRLHERLLLRGAVDRVLAVSQHTAKRLARSHGFSESLCRILPNAIDLDENEVAEPAFRRSGPDAGLLSVTRLAATERDKGIAQVIEAVARLRQRHPHLVYEIVGDGALREPLQALAVERGVADHVRLLGSLSQDALDEAYRRASIFVLPSKKEGFGIVFLEAWKHGLPIVCGDSDASPEIVGDGGVAVDPDDLDALTQTLSQLLERPDERARLARNGYTRLTSLYTHRHFVLRLRELLGELAPDDAVRRAGPPMLHEAEPGRRPVGRDPG